jgi:hypothetical protein
MRCFYLRDCLVPNSKENDMIKRLKTSTGVVAGIAALALGGSGIAGAASTTPSKARSAPTHESTTAPDADNIQSGSQTTSDRGSTGKAGSSTSETSSESNGDTTANNDGPGGHADEPGNPNADTQQQGQH